MYNRTMMMDSRSGSFSSQSSWGFDAKAGWYTDEQNASRAVSLFRYPSYGVGLFYGNLSSFRFGENGVYGDLGRSVALYGFFQCPIIRTQKSQFDWTLGLGVSGGHGTWNTESNPQNFSTSTFLNYFVLLGAEYRHIVSDKSSLGVGLSLRHSSNSGFRTPNFGLNLLSLDLSYRFDENGNFDKRYPPLSNPNLPRKWDWSLSVGYGLQQLEKHDRMLLFDKPEYRFSNVTLSSRAMFQAFPKRKFGIGLDFFYSEAGSYLEQVFFHRKTQGDPDGRPERYYLSQQLNGAVVLAHEYGYGKWWLMTDVGFYFAPFNGFYSKEQKTHFYERIGLKYRFSEQFYTAIC
ncbi:MAG: acyloxyacyl hydrolase, partial [Prevotellaceae bacterium]|nr:acyloxyacyl hydrolase [Prevotellaceae bacterium]